MKARPRVSVACTECRRKKIRCSNGHPKCKSCINSSSECVYDVPRKAPPPVSSRRGEGRDNSRRLGRIERMLERVLDGIERDKPELYEFDEDEDGTEVLEAGDPVNVADVMVAPFCPTPSHDPIYSQGFSCVVMSARYMDKTAEYISNPPLLNAFMSSLQSAIDLFCTEPKITVNSTSLSKKAIAQTEAYLRERATDHLDVLITHQEFVDLQRSPIETFGPFAGAGMLIYGAASVVLAQNTPPLELLLLDPPSSTDTAEAIIAYTLAKQAAMNVSAFRPNISILKGIILILNSPLTIAMQPPTVTFLSRRCMEICLDLGLNRRSFYSGLTGTEKERHLRLFWMSYCCDRAVSLRLGCTPFMSSHQITVELPPQDPRTSDLCYLRPYVDLLNLYDLTYEKLSSVSAERRHLRGLIRDVITCDQKLEQWRNNLEPWMKVYPNFEYQDMGDDAKAQATRNHLVAIEHCYYHLTICMHRMTALVPCAVKQQLSRMFPSSFQAYTTPQSIRSATATPDNSVDGELSPHDLNYRVSRVLNSLDICADAARQLFRFNAWPFESNTCTVPERFELMDFYDCVSTLMIKSILRTDINCRDDSKLMRDTSLAIGNTDAGRRLPIFQEMIRLLNATADIVDHMLTKHNITGDSGEATTQPLTGDGGTIPNGLFESLASELFPDLEFSRLDGVQI